MLKNTLLASITVAAMVMFAGCSAEDVADAYVDGYYDDDYYTGDGGSYSFCAYYTNSSYTTMSTVCTTDEDYYYDNMYYTACTGEIYSSFSQCDDYAEAAGYNGAPALESVDANKASAITDAVAATAK